MTTITTIVTSQQYSGFVKVTFEFTKDDIIICYDNKYFHLDMTDGIINIEYLEKNNSLWNIEKLTKCLMHELIDYPSQINVEDNEKECKLTCSPNSEFFKQILTIRGHRKTN